MALHGIVPQLGGGETETVVRQVLALPRRPPERALPLAAGTTAGSHQEVAGHRAPNQGGPAARAAGTGRIQNTHGHV